MRYPDYALVARDVDTGEVLEVGAYMEKSNLFYCRDKNQKLYFALPLRLTPLNAYTRRYFDRTVGEAAGSLSTEQYWVYTRLIDAEVNITAAEVASWSDKRAGELYNHMLLLTNQEVRDLFKE